jgi:RelA/SpoT family (p)ppGpp synthetase
MEEEQIIIEPFFELPLEKFNPYGQNVSEDLNVLLTNCIKYIENVDLERITKAFYFCVDAHQGVFRSSGAPYYTHPLKVAISLLKDFSVNDNNCVIAALLHDIVEDVDNINIELISQKFGNDIAHVVDGVTKIKGSTTREMDKAGTYGKLFLYLVKDVRVILIKLADRLDNMSSLIHLRKEKQVAIAHETLNFYTPFAQRLGLTKVKKALEDLSLYFIDMQSFNNIHKALKEKRIAFLEYIRNFLAQINQKLNERNVSHVLTLEHKHIYEIFKMMEQGKNIADIDNFYSMVINLKTNDYSEAYRTYGIIANIFGPVSSLDDYIARPKINLYRALHSTHFGPGRKLIEVIIRTQEMDKIVEKGITGFYSISNLNKPLSLEEKDVVEWVDWMQDIIETGEQDAIQQIWGSIKKNLYDDDMAIHTKEGNSYILPQGSCPIDLAFAVSEDVAFHCISAKVNDEVKSLDYELNNNDYVELITTPKIKPDPEWQYFVITNKAVVKLHNYFKNHDVNYDNHTKNHTEIYKLRVVANDRKNLLNDIISEIGTENIHRLFLHNFNSVFEGLFLIRYNSNNSINIIFTRLLSINGIKGVDRVD